MNAPGNRFSQSPWGNTTAYGDRLIEELLKQYPHGTTPMASVTLCKVWLLKNEPEGSDLSRRLDGIEINADDQTWSLDGEPRGDCNSLLVWTKRYASDTCIAFFRAQAWTWYQFSVRLLRQAAQREVGHRALPVGNTDTDRQTVPSSTSEGSAAGGTITGGEHHTPQLKCALGKASAQTDGPSPLY